MEKSWENFWTTGNVEDYLTYRNRVADEKEHRDEQLQEDTQQRKDTSWKGLK